MVLIVLCYALLASTFTIAKATLEYAKPFFVIGFRMTVAGSIMLGYLFFFGRKYLFMFRICRYDSNSDYSISTWRVRYEFT